MAFIPKVYEPDFEPIGHIYSMPDGRQLDSVTQILKAELNLWQYGTCEAAERGTRIHLACQYHDEKRLDIKSVSEIDMPYLETYIRAKKELGIKILQNEIRRYHGIYLFAGTIDKLAEINGEPILLDLKTGSKNISYKWQTAAYLKLIQQESRRKWRRAGLYIGVDSYSLEYYDCETDWAEFLALYSAHNVKKSYGFRKQKQGEN